MLFSKLFLSFFTAAKCRVFRGFSFVTLHAKGGRMDFTKNQEFFPQSRCMNWTLHSVNSKFHAVFTL